MAVKVKTMAKANRKVAAKKTVAPPREEQLDSRGRRIGARGVRHQMEGGSVFLTAEERATLRSIASRAVAGKGNVTAFDRAMALDVNESDVALGTSLQSFAMALAQARKTDALEGREFNYTTSVFSPGVGHPAVNVLWITRTA